MKQYIFLLLTLFAACNSKCFAQKIVINLTNGKVAEYKASDVTSIEFTEADDSDIPGADNDPETKIEEYNSLQTLLFYFIADNNLSSFLAQDLKECCQGYLKSDGNLNLQIYIDGHENNKGKPMLMNVRRNSNHDELIYDTLHVWQDDINSADPEIMSNILKEAFSGVFDTPIKGIVLSGHGFAWTPSASYKTTNARNNATSGIAEPQWFGQDDNYPKTNYMELWDMTYALKNSGVELTYMILDACFMSNAETAYELRDCARYMIASVCEIAAYGYNYVKVMQELSKLKDKTTLKDVLSKVVDCYGEEYNDTMDATGQLTLLDLTYMDEIAAAYKKVRKGNAISEEMVISHDSLSTNGKPLAKMQSYGRYYVGCYFDYFDLAECASKLGDDGTINKLLEKAVIREFHASRFRPVPEYMAASDNRKGVDTESFPFTSCCGLSVSLPEMFEIGERYNKPSSHPTLDQMQSAYSKTQWGKFMEQ